MTASEFHAICRELIDDNPLAIRAVLKILETEFTDTVPTLAVTCDQRPRLLVNLAFIGEHCRTESEVKAVICHEFLHVLLRHTERTTQLTPPEHLALDAVINAIIHRSLGPEYSAMMSGYYAKATGVDRLLRPPTAEERLLIAQYGWSDRGRAAERRLFSAWGALYDGRLVADDIRDFARDHLRRTAQTVVLLGNHDALDAAGRDQGEGAAALADALDSALKAMNGSGVFRSPRGRGVGANAYRNEVRAADRAVEQWCREAYAVLRRHLLPDRASAATERAATSCVLPVLSPGDRRAVLRSLWSAFLPEAHWDTTQPVRAGSAHVYLDVSGSMDAEMPLIVALLGRLTPYIRRPFWAFSNVVAPARIEQGRLVADTTGGTSLGCVPDHVARTRPRAAIIVTGGYIEHIKASQMAAAGGTRLHAIVTRDGNAALLLRAGLPYTQLSRLPS